LSPVSRAAARRRRLVTRALPLVGIAAFSFAAGAITANDNEVAAAESFAQAWERQDFKAMHNQLTDGSASRYPLAKFRNVYESAERTITAAQVSTGGVHQGETPEGEDAAVIPIRFETHAFGEVSGDLVVPLSDGSIAWTPNLVFPGLVPGEQLQRRTRAPERAPILANDGTPLASGPASARTSPLGSVATAVAGEVGTPKRAEAEEVEARGFPAGTLTGISGLELAFNNRLSGQPGGQLLAVAAGEGRQRILASGEPKAGKPVRTTIDPGLQRAAVSALGDLFGGVAVLDARKGSVLALAGAAFSAPQPPGSTFKVITTTAALDAGVVKLSDTFPVVQSAVVGGREIANAHDEYCGGTFPEAFAKSCNSVFAPLGPKIGSEQLVGTAEAFGFNSPPTMYNRAATAAVDPPSSSLPKSIPDDLDLGVTAIGQGEVLATPLELASVAQTIAAGGMRSPTPIVDGGLGPDAKPVRVTSKETAATVTDLMEKVVNEGTGTAGAVPGVQVAGKTGTAEIGPKPFEPGQEPAPGEQPEQEVDAWFTAFAPAGDPSLVAAAMVVNADGDGGTVAAPIVQQVLATGLGAG
jgi:cell division protein FtsI/penicillin-binding protein 2